MNDGIIIEKDGNRYWFDDTTPIYYSFFEIVEAYKAHRCLKAHTLPPVERTDKSEVIARLERCIERRDAQIRVLRRENAKLREALKDVLTVAKNRLPTIPTVFECEAIGKAQEIVKGETK